MIATFASTKGGCGKSVLAINVAIIRAKGGQRRTLLVDADEQGSSATFGELRASVDFSVVSLHGSAVLEGIKHHAPDFPEIVVDVGGRDTESLRAALLVTNRLIVPVQPRSLDIWAFENMVSLVAEAKTLNPNLIAYSILSLADAQGKDNEQAANLLTQYDATITHLDCPIVRRKVWADAISAGLGVTEYTPRNSKAVAEIGNLVKAIYATRSSSRGR